MFVHKLAGLSGSWVCIGCDAIQCGLLSVLLEQSVAVTICLVSVAGDQVYLISFNMVQCDAIWFNVVQCGA